MPEAIAEAPVAAEQSLAQAMEAHIQYTENQGQPPVQQQQEQTTEEQVQIEQPVQESSTENTGKKWEKLGKPAEEKPKEETPETEEEYPDGAPKEQNAWTKIKREVKDWRTKHKEWETERTSWTAREQEYETKLKEALEKASKVNESDLQELQKYREERAIYDVQRTDTYQNEAAKPWNEGNSTLKEISEYTRIDVDKFKEVLTEPNSLLRNSKISKLLKTARMPDESGDGEVELDPSEIAALVTQVTDAGKKLHDASAAHKRLTEEAALKGSQRATQEQAAKLKAEQEAKEVYGRGMKEMTTNMQVQLKDLIDAGALDPKVFEDISREELPTDPMDQIYALHASHMLIPMAQQLRQALAKVAELENDRKERQSVRPGTKVTPSQGNKNGRVITLEEAMRAEMQHQGMV